MGCLGALIILGAIFAIVKIMPWWLILVIAIVITINYYK